MVDQRGVGIDSDIDPNPARTTCDQADFVKAGADPARAKVYLIPEADVPSRFGLSEIYGVFRTADKARSFMQGVRTRVARCEDRDLATTVTSAARGRVGRSGADWATWDLLTEISEKQQVHFRVGFVRVGRTVAHLLFVSAPDDDMSAKDFRTLLVRAGDRLLELG